MSVSTATSFHSKDRYSYASINLGGIKSGYYPLVSCRILHRSSPSWSCSFSCVCEIIHETCSANVTQLMDSYIRFPTGDQLDNVVDGFLIMWGVPNCVGAIDGSHYTNSCSY